MEDPSEERSATNKMTGVFQSGQLGQTVNLLSFDFGGSNPSAPTLTFSDIIRSLAERCVSAAQKRGDGINAEVAQLIEH